MKSGAKQLLLSDQIVNVLENHNIRPTSQRVDIAKVLLAKLQHVSAEDVLGLVNKDGDLVSKATVYNTLNLFANKGLVKQVVIDSSYVFYDSNIQPHHHFYNEDTGLLQDIDDDSMFVKSIPRPPENTVQTSIEVIIRVKNQS